jgi:hypothetical protein
MFSNSTKSAMGGVMVWEMSKQKKKIYITTTFLNNKMGVHWKMIIVVLE